MQFSSGKISSGSEKGVFWKRGLFRKVHSLKRGLFRKVHFLEILENLEILEILENPQTVENKGESDHFLEILENLEILEILEIFSSEKTPFVMNPSSGPEFQGLLLENASTEILSGASESPSCPPHSRHRVNGVGREGGQAVFNQILNRFHGIRLKSG